MRDAHYMLFAVNVPAKILTAITNGVFIHLIKDLTPSVLELAKRANKLSQSKEGAGLLAGKIV